MSSESSGPTGQVFSYDVMGRVLSNWQCTPLTCGHTPYLLSYGYDLAGDMTSAGNGAGVTFTYAYNTAPRLTTLTSSLVDAQHPGTLLSNAHYGPFGPATDTLGNGISETIAYNARGMLQSYSSTPPVYSFNLAGLAGDGTITADAVADPCGDDTASTPCFYSDDPTTGGRGNEFYCGDACYGIITTGTSGDDGPPPDDCELGLPGACGEGPDRSPSGSNTSGGNTTNANNTPKQTFSQCMAANSSTFSIAGVVQGGLNKLLGANLDFKDSFLAQLIGGNSVSGFLFGSLPDAAIAAGANAPGLVNRGMGSTITYGRRTSDIVSLNIAGKGGLPQALSSSTGGIKGVLGTADSILSLGMDLTTRLEIDAGLTAAEAAYCTYKTR